jgi:hypothetical protein
MPFAKSVKATPAYFNSLVLGYAQMKFIASILIILFSVCLNAAELSPNEDWAREPEEWCDDDIDINKSDFIEVPVSRSHIAIFRLKEVSIVKLSYELIPYYLGFTFPAEGSKTPYLIRATYIPNGGNFNLSRCNDSLFVSHSGAGAGAATPSKTALIVYLDFEPRNIYIEAYGYL